MLSVVIGCSGGIVLPTIGWYDEDERLIVEPVLVAGGPMGCIPTAAGAVMDCAGRVKPLKLFKTGELVADGRKLSSAAAWSAAFSNDVLLVVGGRGGVQRECVGGGVEGVEASVLMSGPRCARRTVRLQMAAAAFFFFLAFRVLLTFPMILGYPWIRKNVLSKRNRFF